MKKTILYVLLSWMLGSAVAQKRDSIPTVTAAATPNPNDVEIVLLPQYELQQKVLNLENLAIKNGWIIEPKFGVLNAKDVSQFQTLPDADLSKTYTLDILRRFAESLRLSVIGTKAVLVKNIKEEVLKRSKA